METSQLGDSVGLEERSPSFRPGPRCAVVALRASHPPLQLMEGVEHDRLAWHVRARDEKADALSGWW